MPDPQPHVAPGVRIPAAALEARGVRSGGPGGQNVNKVASRAELLVDLAAVEGLDEGRGSASLRSPNGAATRKDGCG